MPSDDCLAIIRRKAQFFDAAHAGVGRMDQPPIGEICEAALKHGRANDHDGIDRHEKG
jgi:hypothetical protein